MYDYNARFYSPALGRFLSPDSIVPSPGNPQSLNRYAYGLNNPLRYTDPTGHFSEEQLGTWFGDNWRDLFDDTWEAILWLAEFGDAVVYGGTTAVFAEQNDMLVGWNVGTRNTQAVTSIVSSHANASINLYRPWGANPNRGPSDGNILALGEMTAPEMAASYGTNVLRWIYGDDKSRTPLSLPLDWYRGPYMHMEVSTQFAGWDLGLSDMMDLTATGVATVGARLGGKKLGSAVLAGLGGLTGILALAVEVGDWTTWDTGYTIMSGAGKPVPVPVPTPPVRR